MNGEASEGLTIRGVLTEERGDEELMGALREGEVVGAVDRRLAIVPPWLVAFARDEVIAAVVSAIDQPLIDVLTAGWQKWEELSAAARRSLQEPGGTELIELRDHAITSRHHPRIDVTLDGKEIAHIELGLELDIVVHAATAVVRNGRLSALRTGRADVAARLSVEGVKVAEANRPVELPIEIGLGAGIPLGDVAPVVVLPQSPTDEPTIPR